MTEEEIMREDRRLIELGLDPKTDPAHLLQQLNKIVAANRKAEAEADAKRRKS